MCRPPASWWPTAPLSAVSSADIRHQAGGKDVGVPGINLWIDFAINNLQIVFVLFNLEVVPLWTLSVCLNKWGGACDAPRSDWPTRWARRVDVFPHPRQFPSAAVPAPVHSNKHHRNIHGPMNQLSHSQLVSFIWRPAADGVHRCLECHRLLQDSPGDRPSGVRTPLRAGQRFGNRFAHRAGVDRHAAPYRLRLAVYGPKQPLPSHAVFA